MEYLNKYAGVAVLIVAILGLVMMYYILYAIISDVVGSYHRKQFIESFEKTIEKNPISDDLIWAIEQLATRWNQSAPMVLNAIQNIVHEKAKNSISNYEIKRLKEIMDRYENSSILSSVPFLLRPYIEDLLQDSRVNKQKTSQLAKHIKEVEVEYAKKYSRQNIKGNLSLAIGLIGILVAIWQVIP